MTMNWKPDKKLAAYCLGMGVLYGIFNFISGKIHLPGCSFVELRPQVALPMFMGLIYGPVAGFVVGCLGDRLGYAYQGLSLLHAWNWSIGNGFIGMIPGIAYCMNMRKIRSIRDFELMMLLVILASSLPIVFAGLVDTLAAGLSFVESLYTLILPAFITDAIFGLLLMPLMLIFARRLDITIETRTMLMITYTLILAVLITYSASNWTMFESSAKNVFLVRDLYDVGILSLCVLIVGLRVSALLARKITRPVVCLTDAAAAIAKGDYTPHAGLAKIALRHDEIGQLSAVFQEMMREVYVREERLKSEVHELKIEIDKAKQAREVAKITGTDYFKQLREKANKLRIE